MKKKTKSFWMNPWTVTVGGGLIVLLVTVIIDIITAEKILSTLGKVLSVLWTGTLAFLNFKLKVWWVLAGIVGIIFVLYLWVKYLDSKQAGAEHPKFIEYTHDTILEYEWKWTWEKNYDGKYKVDCLHPVCTQCGTPLTHSSTGFGRLRCLRCQKEYWKALPSKQDVELMISDNVRRKYFPND